jgi:hypothetical protein
MSFLFNIFFEIKKLLVHNLHFNSFFFQSYIFSFLLNRIHIIDSRIFHQFKKSLFSSLRFTPILFIFSMVFNNSRLSFKSSNNFRFSFKRVFLSLKNYKKKKIKKKKFFLKYKLNHIYIFFHLIIFFYFCFFNIYFPNQSKPAYTPAPETPSHP